ncbi:MAG TPA: terminase family protein [Nitratidesulfovibrio sp.]|nr:terminase family protein [Nitratidesulfovibrio sp.]
MGAILYPYQRNWIDDRSRFKVGMFARQTGKTFTTTLEIAEDVVECELEGGRTRWVILSRGERQAREAMDEGLKLHLKALGAGFDAFESDFRLSDKTTVKALEVIAKGGSRVTALPANPDTARGFSANVFLDEFAFHQDSAEIWKALFPVVSKPGLKLRITSTPNGKGNKFYSLMTGTDATWSRHVVDIYKAVADGLPRDIEELRAGIDDELAWAQEYECSFEVSAFNQFMAHVLVEDAMRRPLPEVNGQPLIMGVDVARFGGDRSVLRFRRGLDARTIPPRVFHGLDTMQLADQVARAWTELAVDAAMVDGTGVGGGVVDRLRQLNFDPFDVNFGGKSARPDARDKATEMWMNLRDWLATGCLPVNGVLSEELTTRQYRYAPDQKTALESKDAMRRRGVKSPDDADALALTFAHPVAPRDPMRELLEMLRPPYDPLRTDYGYDPLRGYGGRK